MFPATRWAFALVALAALCSLTGAAAAQDYTVTRVGGRYVIPPQDATDLGLGRNGSKAVDLPFPFPYFGTVYDSVRVTSDGAVEFGPVQTGGNFRPCAPFGTGLDPSSGGKVVHWTSGSGNQRVFNVGWIGIPGSLGLGRPSFELQLHEDGAKFVFAYADVVNGSDWSPFGGFTSSLNIRADSARAADQRFIVPDPNHIVGHPGTDFEMTPRVVTYRGRLTYDQLVVDAGGIGSSVNSGVPLGGLTAALAFSNGDIAVTGLVAADGAVSLTTAGLDATDRGDLALLLETEGVRVVREPKGRTEVVSSLATLDFSAGSDFGTLNFDESADPDGSARSVLHTALTLQRAHAWASARAVDEIGQLEVVVNGDLPFDTGIVPGDDEFDAYFFVAGGPASPTFAGPKKSAPGSTAPDTWDRDVIARLYGRHVIGTIAAAQTSDPDDGFDTVSDEENAFALAFGHYLAAVLSDSSDFVDGVDEETADVIDVEDPSIQSPRGADVAGRVAAALFDLLDGANETHDTVDGTGDPGAILAVVDLLDEPPTLESFLEAWVAQGHDGPAAARILIHNGALADDDAEFDDVSDARTSAGEVGVRIDGRVLNPFNEDWLGVTLGPVDTTPAALVSTVKVNTARGPVRMTLEVLDEGGNVVGTQSGDVSPGAAMSAPTGTVGPGEYRIRLRHDGLARLADYTVQSHRPFAATVEDLPDWTVGRPYAFGLTIAGGIPPYTVQLGDGASAPPGLTYDADLHQIRGTPLVAGTYLFNLRVSDAGNPVNERSVFQEMVISEGLRFEFPRVLPFPLGKVHTVAAVRTGGTAPLLFTLIEGDLPPGIDLDGDAPVLQGTAGSAGSFDLRIEGLDAAGSGHTTGVRAVVAVAALPGRTPLVLDEGDSNLGVFVDAVLGSQIKFKAKTAKKRPKRLLDAPVVLAADGGELEGGTRKGGNGKASVTRLVVPATGRYFVVTGGDAGPATELTGKLKVVAPNQAADQRDDVSPGAPQDFAFGALEGARVTLDVARSKKSNLVLRPQALIGPGQQTVPLDGLVTETRTGFRVRAELPAGGTWTLRVGVVSGSPDRVTFRARIKQPRNVNFQLE